MTRVVFALERNAKTDPPNDDTPRVTNLGIAHHIHGDWWQRGDDGPYSVVFPEPWYDLRPTEGEGVTVDDLETAIFALEADRPDFPPTDEEFEVADRLRAALDALTRD